MSASGPEPPFTRLGICGLGLIGASIAIRARATWPHVKVAGIDQPAIASEAQRLGIVDDSRAAIAELTGCDLVILATPVPAIIDLISQAARARLPGVLTDVGSTKREILSAASRAGLRGFVGGHPMAGAESGGLSHARPDLFEARPWMLVQNESGDGVALDLVERFVRGLGARPRRLDAATHDRTMAYVSHVPQLVALALMTAAGEACGDAGLSASGRAFGEMTRLAASPSDLWGGILTTNADFVAEALAVFVSKLPPPERLGDDASLEAIFAEARRWREQWCALGIGGPV